MREREEALELENITEQQRKFMEFEKRINPEFPNYWIYENGDVVNIKTGKKHKFEIHKRCSDIQLINKDGKQVHVQLARLVVLTFIDKYHVHHCDIDNANNGYQNLALVSAEVHRYLHKLVKENKKLKEEMGKL